MNKLLPALNVETDLSFSSRFIEPWKITGLKSLNSSFKKYIVDLIFATRYPEKYNEELGSWVDFGASPRGTIALDKCSRVMAWLNNRDFVQPDDIRAIIHDVLRHRLILSYEANAEGIGPDAIIDEILKVVAVV